jgi:arylsulfatase A-like enzyme
LTWLKPRGRRPVFLFVHLFDPHWPYGPADAALPGGAAKDFHEFAAAVLNADENVRRVWVARYREAVRHADHAVGRLFAALQASGRWNDAWVIVVSDHGEEWWDHGFLGHAVTLFDEVLHVPLLLKRPGQTAARAIDRPVSLLDVPATLVEELQLPGARDLDGRDLLRADAEPRSLFASSAIWGGPRFALIRGCGKGITSYHWRFGRFHGERPDSYYDLCADPAEAHNGAEVESGLTLLSQLWMQTGAMRPRGGVAASTPSPLVRERLRDLGYLQ